MSFEVFSLHCTTALLVRWSTKNQYIYPTSIILEMDKSSNQTEEDDCNAARSV